MVVAVGLIGLDVPRNALLRQGAASCACRARTGPGATTATYEEDGVDYPLGYVRWTEQRNMEAFLDLVAAGKVHGLAGDPPRADRRGRAAYQIVTGEIAEPYLGILLSTRAAGRGPTRASILRPRCPCAERQMRLGVIGAGNFANRCCCRR